jgi:hypothetical protein
MGDGLDRAADSVPWGQAVIVDAESASAAVHPYAWFTARIADGRPGGASTTRSWPTSPQRTARTSTSSAPSTSTSKVNSRSSARPATGRCGCATPSSGRCCPAMAAPRPAGRPRPACPGSRRARHRPFSSRRRKATLSCAGAGRGRYSRILPRTCGRWSPSEMPSVGNCLAISSAVRGPGWRCSCGTRRSGTQIAHTPAHARERVERYRNASAKADSLCCRWPWKAFPSGQTAAAVRESWPWVRRCPCEGEIEIRWVLLEPSRVRRAESGTRGLPADADRAPIRFPRRARLYV